MIIKVSYNCLFIIILLKKTINKIVLPYMFIIIISAILIINKVNEVFN